MYKILDMEKWPRRDHFSFFSKFEEPFFGITAQVNCEKAYDLCKKNEFSFFLYYLHACLFAANKIENFRFRIQGKDVIIFESFKKPLETKIGIRLFGFKRNTIDFLS